ncbi:Uncharacterised protein [Mycobacterium tuberculosis]|uniref:Uncharacterized protein n=1 Tax=Mycobacterium tuberculosis TaxID=1773 RepID=A0A654U5I0_MYCTX|nr:Uncharacterised protein [Mycobacterium tuberculosis]
MQCRPAGGVGHRVHRRRCRDDVRGKPLGSLCFSDRDSRLVGPSGAHRCRQQRHARPEQAHRNARPSVYLRRRPRAPAHRSEHAGRRPPSIHHVQAVQRALHLRARPPPRSRRTGRDGQRVRPRPNAGLRLGPRLSADPATGVPSPVADAARPSLRSQHPGLRRTPGGAGGRSAVRGRDGPIFRGRQGDPVFRRVLRSGKGARPLGNQ